MKAKILDALEKKKGQLMERRREIRWEQDDAEEDVFSTSGLVRVDITPSWGHWCAATTRLLEQACLQSVRFDAEDDSV